MSAIVEWLIGGTPGPDGHLQWGADQTTWVVAAAAALVAWMASVPGERAVLSRLIELVCTAIALVALVIMVARPTWVEEQGRQEPGRVAVLVDGSRSMSVLERGVARSDQANSLLDSLDLADADLYTFGDDLAIGRPSAYDLPGTDLEGALVALSERVAGEKLAGIVVITDGIDRGLLRQRFKKSDTEPALATLPGPLTVYQVGSVGELHDLAVRTVEAGGYAFVRSPFRLRAQIDGIGYEGRSITAQLLRDGKPVTTTTVTIDANGQAEAAFDVTPDAPGRFSYAVQVPVFDDDAVPTNNIAPVVVRVVRDRIRVLQVAGAPSWDVKAMRRFLKGDPSVDLVSFFILRTNLDNDHRYDDQELSLIPFPHEQLFTEDLKTFDVVIFQNFDHAPYFQNSRNDLLQNLADFVTEDGHAFAMIGGDRSFDLGQYNNTPLGNILPVTLGAAPTGSPDCDGLCDVTPFRPVLTDEGRRHPITRLGNDPAENDAWWERLHAADGTNLINGIAPDAAVLLAHPSLKTADGSPMPILAVREVGAGRTMALSIDASWRWSFSEAAEGRGNQAYLRFWKNAFRWLVADPSSSRLTAETGRENYALGDTVRVVVRARDPGFAALPGAKIKATLEGNGVNVPLEGVTGPDGELVLEWLADHRGSMRVHVDATHDNESVGAVDTVFAVTTRDPELDEVIPDERFLRWVTERAGGRLYTAGNTGPFLRDPAAGRTVWDRRETPIGRAPILGITVVLFAGLGFLIRRRAGLR